MTPESKFTREILAALTAAAVRQTRTLTVQSELDHIVKDMHLQRGLWLFKSERRADLSLNKLSEGGFPWGEGLPTCLYCKWFQTETVDGLGDITVCRRLPPAPCCCPVDSGMQSLDGESNPNGAWTANAGTTLAQAVAAPMPGNCIRMSRAAIGNALGSQSFYYPGRYHITGYARGDGVQIPELQIRDASLGFTLASLWGGGAANVWQAFDITTPAVTPNQKLCMRSNMGAAGYVEFNDFVIELIYNEQAFWNQVLETDKCGDWFPIGGDGVPWVLGNHDDRNTQWLDNATGNGPRPGAPGEPVRPDEARVMLVEKDALVLVELPPLWTLTASLLSEVAP